MAASFHFASLLTPISAMQNVRLSDIMIYEAMDIVLWELIKLLNQLFSQNKYNIITIVES